MPEQQPNPNKRPMPVMDTKPLAQLETKSFGGITIGGVFMSPHDSESQAIIKLKQEQIARGQY